jgi:glycosyltransferase involved in cell wall biosynthesis
MHPVSKVRLVNDRASMRILFVARRYWPAVGGVESFLRQLAHELARRHELTVLAHRIDNGPSERMTDSLRPPPSFEPFRDGNVLVLPLRLSPRERFFLAPLASHVVPGLRRYAYGRARVGAASLYAAVVAPTIARAGRDADVLHMWGSDLVAAAAVRAARQLDIPSVVTPFAHRGQWGDGPADAFAYRAADRVIGLLDIDAEIYRDLGVAEERLTVCGVCSPGVRAGAGVALRERYGISGPLVLFLGVRRPYKGFDLLLEAASIVGSRLEGITFAFVGPGAPMTAAARGVRLIDVGAVDDDTKDGWLEAADLLCLPSRGEIFPVSILEAWSIGTPVLVSDLPTLSELVEKSGGGATAPLDPGAMADKIVALLGDSERLVELGEAGKRFWSTQCTPERVAAWHEQLYESISAREDALCAA